MGDFQLIKPGMYFVTDETAVEKAVRNFKGEDLLAALELCSPGMGNPPYQYRTNLVKELDTVNYPRIIGMQFDHLSRVEIVFSFDLLDTIDLTANFTQRGYT